MANETHEHYWVLDSLGTVSEEPVLIDRIRWEGASAAGHTLVLTDVDGVVLWESVASGANYVEESRALRRCNSLTLFARGSGKVYIYLE